MKIACIARQVLDADQRLATLDGRVSHDGVTFVLDGMDAYGVEQALQIRERRPDSEVLVLGLGADRVDGALRHALSMGADRAILLEVEAELDPLTQASLLAGEIRREGADLVFVGGRDAEGDSSALGPAMAEALGWPHSDWTTSIQVSNGSIVVEHDTDRGRERLELPLPAVVTTQQGLDEPRRPTLQGMMAAQKTGCERRAPGIEGDVEPRTTIVNEKVVVIERRGEILEGSPEEAARALVQRLGAAGGLGPGAGDSP
jgi:electron transfer flavoprotein beta subunit